MFGPSPRGSKTSRRRREPGPTSWRSGLLSSAVFGLSRTLDDDGPVRPRDPGETRPHATAGCPDSSRVRESRYLARFLSRRFGALNAITWARVALDHEARGKY